MQVISVCGVEHEVACNAFTPIVYSGQFKARKPSGGYKPRDISEALGIIADAVSSVGFPAITPLLEIFWAFEKTANRDLEDFDKWIDKFPSNAFDLTKKDSWAADVMQLIEANYFQGSGEDVVAEGAEASDAATAR